MDCLDLPAVQGTLKSFLQHHSSKTSIFRHSAFFIVQLSHPYTTTGKDPDAGKDWRWEEKGTTEDEMVGWHHWHDGHAFEQALGVGDGQGSLGWGGPWGGKDSDTTEKLNWTDSRSALVPKLRPRDQQHWYLWKPVRNTESQALPGPTRHHTRVCILPWPLGESALQSKRHWFTEGFLSFGIYALLIWAKMTDWRINFPKALNNLSAVLYCFEISCQTCQMELSILLWWLSWLSS